MDVTGIKDFIGRENEVLTGALFAGGDTAKFARFMKGVKGSTTVVGVEGEAEIQFGTCKGAQGTTTAREYTLTVKPWTYKEGFCNDDLQTKFPNTMLAPGSNDPNAPKVWEDALVRAKISSLNKQQEKRYWQGDTTSTDAKLKQFDGFIKIIDAATGDEAAIDGNTSSATSITVDNVVKIVEDMIIATPTDVKSAEGYAIYMGTEIFEMYVLAMVKANLYNYNAENNGDTFVIPGLNKTIRKVEGLSGTNRMFAGVGANFVVGMDVENEGDIIKVWYSEDDDQMYFQTKAKSGVMVTYTEQIVEFTLSA